MAWSILYSEGIWGVSPGYVGLYMKGMLRGEFFTISRNWLTLGRVVPLGLSRPQDVKSSNIENKIWLIHKYYYEAPAHLGVGGRRHVVPCSL